MLHLFRMQGDYLAFDVESQALHCLDETAWHVLKAYNDAQGERPSAFVMASLSDAYGLEAEECAREIDQLIKAGELFSKPVPVTLEQLYPDGPKIKSMCLHLCHDCNMRCRYCFAGTGDFGTGRRTMLDLQTGRQAVEFLLEASGDRHNLDLDFFGGEPLLNWPVVVKLTEYCEQRSKETGKAIRLTITTNALSLDEEKADFINRHFKNCVLSIDGRPQVHNRMRPDVGGRGTYDRIARHIQSFVAMRGDREYFLRGTFTRENLDFDADVCHLARMGDHVSIEPVVAPDDTDFCIREQDLPAIEEAYERLARTVLYAEEHRRPFDFFHFNIDLEGGPCLYKRLKGCGVGTEYCAVTPEGDIYPCHQFVGLDQFRLGRVQDRPIQLDESVLEPFRKLLVPDKPTCRDCWARYFCGGGCAANAWFSTGRVDGTYEIGCRMEKKRLECALWIHAKRRLRQDQINQNNAKVSRPATC